MDIRCLCVLVLLCAAAGTRATAEDALPNRPVSAGKLRLDLRDRKESPAKSGQFTPAERTVEWNVAETAIIVCDMWEDHPCRMSAHRVDVMAPEMNRVISAARSLGVLIIHAPSSGIHYYEDTQFRKRVKAAPVVQPGVPIESWCHLDPAREAPYPIPYSTTVQDGCDDPVYEDRKDTSRRQHPAIKMMGYDGVSDRGAEILNLFEQLGIRNVVLMGVHTHYCVLGRSFGIRQMVRLGKHVVVVRDLTDAMYDPRKPPFVSHARGTELAVEHIEKFWCPSILSRDLTVVIPGSDGPRQQPVP